MSSSALALLLIVQTSCEWVEITQQYKKPMRPTHNHPILAFSDKPNEPIRPTTVNYPSNTAVTKLSETERANKRNRIYINHTLQDFNWNTGENKLTKDVNFETSVLNFNENSDVIKRKPTVIEDVNIRNDKNTGDVLIIRRTKPGDINNGERTETLPGHKISVGGNDIRLRHTNKGSFNKLKPLEEYTGPIEVFNLTDLQYTTAEDTFDLKLEEENQKQSEGTKDTNHESTEYKTTKFNSSSYQSKPDYHEFDTKPPAILKTVTNMRRVEILRSTKPTPIEEFREYSSKRPFAPPKTETVHDERTSTTPYKFPNIGNIKRVYKNSTTRATNQEHTPGKMKYPTIESNHDNNFTRQSEANENKVHRIDRPDVSHRRSTTEKTFPIKTKPGKTIFESGIGVKKVPDPEDVMLKELSTEEEKTSDIKVHKVASIGNIKRVSNPKNDRKGSETNKNSEQTTDQETDEDVIVENEESSNSFSNYFTTDNIARSTEEVPIVMTSPKAKLQKTTENSRPEINPQVERYEVNPYNTDKPSKSVSQFVTNKVISRNETDIEKTLKTNQKPINRIKTEPFEHKKIINQGDRTKNNANKEPEPQVNKHRDSDTEEPLSNDRKDNTMENLIKFLKTVTDIIVRNTRRGVHSKMKYLEDLRDTIMANIEERLEAAFPDDTPESESRPKRSAEPRGHVEFPSSEGALMTISFLTFAVFLIKLVLQVIQAYKNKTMMMMPTVLAAVGRAYSKHHNN